MAVLSADDTRRSQVGYGGRIGRAEHGLPGEWPLLRREHFGLSAIPSIIRKSG
jgi:hypothetical protein